VVVIGILFRYCSGSADDYEGYNPPEPDPAVEVTADLAVDSAQIRAAASPVEMTLEPGTYTVGNEIPAGRYDLLPVGEIGASRVTVAGAGLMPNVIDEYLGPDSIDMPRATATLVEGAPILIDGSSSVVFRPAPTEVKTELNCGQWLVGLDVEPGTYRVELTEEAYGRIVTSEPEDPYAEAAYTPLDGMDNGEASTTLTVEAGQLIWISGLPSVTLTPTGQT
jgi:hypothetical protein